MQRVSACVKTATITLEVTTEKFLCITSQLFYIFLAYGLNPNPNNTLKP